MANAAGWNPSDKHADITLSSIPTYLGTNVGFLNSNAINTWRSVRSVGNKSSGKWIFYVQNLYPFSLDNISWGVGNGSFLLTDSVNGSVNSYGMFAGGVLFFNGSSTYSLPASFSPNTIAAIAFDATNGRLYCRVVATGNPGSSDSGWIDWSGTAADPTNSSQGTNIAGLGTPLYAIGSARNPGNPAYNGFGNFGGWPPPSDLIPIPSGYSLWDANYPYTMPAGHFTLTSVLLTLSQGNMRATAIASGSNPGIAYSRVFPAATKTINAIYWDATPAFNTSGHIITNNDTSPTYASCAAWLANGTTQNLGGTTWPGVWSTSVTYMAVDRANNRAWITPDNGVTWYGDGSGTPDPATNTHGADISGVGTPALQCPGIYLSTGSLAAATFNAGKLTDPFTLPTGFEWLERTFVSSSSFGAVIG